ncbi:MAG: hypothetical protein N3D85_06195 [Candidatus Bathyarchaeota archaeon]|nr:hypothetical protein [Candidatus Bathyarchaeota archaeon]
MYKFGLTVLNLTDVPVTDMPGSVGFGFRAAASFIALIVSLFYLVGRELSKAELITSLRWIVLLEAAYWLLFLPVGFWGFNFQSVLYSREFFIIEAGLPCLLQAIVMPTVLGILFFKLSPAKSSINALRWALVVLAAYMFVFWFNYTSQWWSEIYLQGTAFLLSSARYAFEFSLTVVGLFLVAVYSAVYAKNFFKTKSLDDFNPKKVGLILVVLGLYFDVILVLWFMFGRSAVLTVWPTFAVLHNVDLWMATLPLIGILLFFTKKRQIRI